MSDTRTTEGADRSPCRAVRSSSVPRRRTWVGAGSFAAAALVVVALVSAGGSGSAGGDLPLINGDPRSGSGAAPMVGAEMASNAGDAKMSAVWGGVEFSLSADLPLLDDPAAAWVFPAKPSPSPAELERLRDALGVDGEFVETVDGAGEPWEWSYWAAGPNDGSAPSVTVNRDGMLSWWYSAGWASSTMSSVVGCVEPAVSESTVSESTVSESNVSEPFVPPTGAPRRDATGDIATPGSSDSSVSSDVVTVDPSAGSSGGASMPVPCGEYIEPDLPENLPDEARSRELFASLLGSLGLDVDDYEVEVYLSEWGSSVNGFLRLDGMRSPVGMYVTFGENERIESASGNLARPERLGEYPRIGTREAFEKLQESYGVMYGDGRPMPMVSEPAADAVTGDVAVQSPEEPVAKCAEPVDPALDPAADDSNVSDGDAGPVVKCAPVPSPEVSPLPGDEYEYPVTVVDIVGVEAGLYMFYGANSEIYLLPGYSFLGATDEYGYTPRYSVIAISDEYFAAPVVDDVMVGVPVDGGSSAGGGVPGEPVVVSDEDASALVGLSEKKASELAESYGWSVRVTSRDGQEFAQTMDYRSDRVNLVVEVDKVISVSVG